MEGDEHVWSPYQRNFSSYSVPSYSNSLPVPVYTAPCNETSCLSQVGYRAPPTYIPVLPTYDQVPPNVNPFSSNDYGSGYLSHNPDTEVSYYSRIRGFEPETHFYDEHRCSSTDTTVSCSSVSTVLSHSSIDMDVESTSQQGSKRKRQESLKIKKSKAKKVENSISTYKRWPKPPYSYCGLIITVIQLSPKRELTLQEIHAGLMELFPFFRGSYLGWRDSVRHNLSHNPCFVKTIRNPPTRGSLWRVDWTKVTPAVFARQQSSIGKSGEYKSTIHEHLGLLPFASEISQVEYSSSENAPRTPRHIKQEDDASRTPQMCDTQRFNVTLPCVESCENQGISPYQVDRREFIPNHVANTSFEQISPVKVSESSEVNKVSSESFSVPSFSHVLDLVVSERRSSMDAVHHLHTLCMPMLHSPGEQSETQLSALSRESDTNLMLLPVTKPCQQVPDDQKDSFQDDLYSPSDFSITGLISPVSPCEAFVTSQITSEIDKDSPTELLEIESECDRAASTAVSSVDDDNEENVEVIVIESL